MRFLTPSFPSVWSFEGLVPRLRAHSQKVPDVPPPPGGVCVLFGSSFPPALPHGLEQPRKGNLFLEVGPGLFPKTGVSDFWDPPWPAPPALEPRLSPVPRGSRVFSDLPAFLHVWDTLSESSAPLTNDGDHLGVDLRDPLFLRSQLLLWVSLNRSSAVDPMSRPETSLSTLRPTTSVPSNTAPFKRCDSL